MNNIEELEEKIEQLKNEIAYEEEKLKICGYGSSELNYIDNLKYELEELQEKLEELQ